MNVNPIPAATMLFGKAVEFIKRQIQYGITKSAEAVELCKMLVSRLNREHLQQVIDLCTERLAATANAASEAVEAVANAVETAAPFVSPGNAPAIKAACDAVESACDQVQAVTAAPAEPPAIA